MKVTSHALMLCLLFMGYVLVYLDKTVMGFVLLPLRQEFHLAPQQVGYIGGIFFLAYALFQFPAGWLNDRIGYRSMLVLSLSLLGLCALLFGWLGVTFALLLSFRFMAGIGHSGYPSASAKAVSANFALHHRTFAQSLLLSSSGLAMAIGPLLAVWALDKMNWHHAYMILAVLVLMVAASMVLLLPRSPRVILIPAGEVGLHSALRQPLLWQLFCTNFLLNVPVYGLVSWLPSFLTHRGLPLSAVGQMMSISGVGSALTSVAGGWLVGRYLAGREPWVICLASLIAAAGMLMIYLSSSLLMSTIGLCITNAALIGTFITTFTLPMKRFPLAVTGSIIGLLNAGGVLGGFVGPIVMGYLVAAGHGTYLGAFLFLMIAILLAGLALLPGSRRAYLSSLNPELS